MIGEGAYSVVYAARGAAGARALKILRPEVQARSAGAAARFRQEAAMLAALDHPAFPTVYALGELDGRPYMALELLSGETLAARARAGPQPVDFVLRVAAAIAAALAEVHRHGLVHRDIKPANIQLPIVEGARPGAAVKLLDFGLARRADARERDPVVGTFLYSAPEQTGFLKRPVDGRTDLYALGAVLFECLSGHPPFDSRNVGELLRMHATATPPELTALGVAPALAGIVATLLAKDPDDRYQSAALLLAELARLDGRGAGPPGFQPEPGAPAQARERASDRVIGRDDVLQTLRALGPDVRARRGAVALLFGPAGAGAARCSARSRRRRRCRRARRPSTCSSRRARPTRGRTRRCARRCAARSRQRPATRTLARPRPAASSPRSRGTSGLAELFAARERDDDPPAEGPGADITPELFSEIFVGYFVELCVALARASLRVLVDDAGRLDPASVGALARLANRTASEPVVLVLAAQAERERDARAVPQLERALATRDATVVAIALRPLADAAARQLVARQLGQRPVDPALSELVARRSGGNPLALREYLNALLDAGALELRDGRWTLDRARVDALELPEDVALLLLARVDALAPATRDVLDHAAALGLRFDAEALERLDAHAPEAVRRALDEARDVRAIEPTSDGDALRFTHERLQGRAAGARERAARARSTRWPRARRARRRARVDGRRARVRVRVPPVPWYRRGRGRRRAGARRRDQRARRPSGARQLRRRGRRRALRPGRGRGRRDRPRHGR
ncbi:MAG: protein kinase [Myxococcales bacterium]|nr:protein kinase [Myxococcales bacterium]